MLGVHINAGSCPEFLPKVIQCWKPFAEIILIHYQVVSNTGRKLPDQYKKISEGNKIRVLKFTPKAASSPKVNETKKRNEGIAYLRKQGMKTFVSCDEDELYLYDELARAANIYYNGSYDCALVQMQTYYKEPTIRITPPEKYFCPLFYDMRESTKFVYGNREGFWSIYKVDPSRKISPVKRPIIFQRHTIQMHHFSYVRRDIRRKLFNASSSVNYKNRLEEIAEYHDNYNFPKPAYFGGKNKTFHEVERCENKFKIYL